jgi:cell division protein FtsB
VRWLTLVLASLIIALQYPLWLGKGSWLKVWEVDQQLTKQKEENERLKARNASLEAEVKDLKTGYEAIEERARAELGMVKQDEVFFQVMDDAKATRPTTSASAKPPAATSKPAIAATPAPSAPKAKP